MQLLIFNLVSLWPDIDLSCNGNRTELTARMGGGETGEPQMHLVMSIEPRMPIIYFQSIPCWYSLFGFPKTTHSPIIVIAG